ncbi:MAG: undecaprenyl-diphosphate phosphatase [Candidatus Omnitrophica bacterium]|nr:undecaprenyl-diphosphate phosphatase [Candidatus Omnitrophota bacterium]
MTEAIILAIIQAATEFLPISSSGHLALVSSLISQPSLFLFTALHLASLVAVIIFTRNEIAQLVRFDKKYRKMWLYLVISTIPAGLCGVLFSDLVEKAFSSNLFIGAAFIFTGFILFLTKFTSVHSGLNGRNALIIGLFQVLGIFPGVSRSGMTISSALFLGIDREKAAKFSFLLFMPVSLGAFLLELGHGFYFNAALLVSFLVCLILSLLFLKLLLAIVKKGQLWFFSFYCVAVGIVCLFLFFKR